MSADELDVDAELLAMAGDSSDDESDAGEIGEIVDETQGMDGPRTPSEEAKPSVEKVVEEAPSARRGVAQKVRKNRRKRDRRREIEDELDDLGDGSPSPPGSVGSGAMSESPGPADAPGSPESIDDGPLYPLEGKFMSVTDRDHILSLPEIERESILAERAQEVLSRQQDLQLKKALAASEAANSKRKRKVTAAELDEDGARKTSRPKTEKGRSALDDYKKAREAKGAERTSRSDPRRDRRRSRSASYASDRDADGESEVEWAEPSSYGTRRDKDEPLAELRDFERCRIGRTPFAKICFYPNFEETMKGCFCRVSIGVNRESGQNMYRMTQIKGFTQGKPYPLETPQGKTFHTDQYALVSHGSAEKPWPFSACSDSAFTEPEFQKYKETLEKERIRIPKRNWLVQKLDDLHRFLNVSWTDDVLQGKFKRQREMERRVDPANAVKIKREGIVKRRLEAEEKGDEEEIARCEAELAAMGVGMDPEATAAGSGGTINGAIAAAKPPIKSSPLKTGPTTATATGPAHTQTQQERLALLNQKNRGKNADDVRRALLEERKKLQREREKALADAKAKAEAAAAEAERKKAEAALLGVPGRSDFSDLFGDISDVSRAGTPMSGVSTPKLRRSRAGTPMNGVGGGGGGKKEKSGLGMVVGVGDEKKKKGKKEEGDELGGLDLGIDVEI